MISYLAAATIVIDQAKSRAGRIWCCYRARLLDATPQRNPAKFFPEAIPGEVFREEIQSDNAKND
jgi:hypothetical protein